MSKKSPTYRISIAGTDITEYVKQIRLTEAIKKDNQLTLNIREEYVLRFVDNPDIQPDAEIRAQFGYIGDPLLSPVHILKIVDIGVTYGDKISMVIKGSDKGVDMKRNVRGKVWKGQRPSDIAKQMAADYGLKADVDTSSRDLLNGQIPQGHQSDLEFLRELAMKESEYYRVWITSDTLYYKKEDYASKTAVQTYTYGTDSRIISFKPKWNRTLADGVANTVKPIAVDDKTKEVKANTSKAKDTRLDQVYEVYDYDAKYKKTLQPIEGNAKPTSSTGQANTGSNQTVAQWDNRTPQAAESNASLVINPTDPDTTAVDNAVASMKNNEDQKVMTASLAVVGDPVLRVDEILTMGGQLGQRHKGNWHICAITHSLSISGYTSEIQLDRDSQKKISGDGLDNSEKSNKTTGVDKKTSEKIVPTVSFDFNGDEIEN